MYSMPHRRLQLYVIKKRISWIGIQIGEMRIFGLSLIYLFEEVFRVNRGDKCLIFLIIFHDPHTHTHTFSISL